MFRSIQGRSDLNKHLIVKIAIKHFLKNILRLLKNDDVSTLAKHYYQFQKNVCKMQSIENKITVDDKKVYRKKRRIVIKQKVWYVWSLSGYFLISFVLAQ